MQLTKKVKVNVMSESSDTEYNGDNTSDSELDSESESILI